MNKNLSKSVYQQYYSGDLIIILDNENSSLACQVTFLEPCPSYRTSGPLHWHKSGTLVRLVTLMLEGVRLRGLKGLRAPQRGRTSIGIPVDSDQYLGT